MKARVCILHCEPQQLESVKAYGTIVAWVCALPCGPQQLNQEGLASCLRCLQVIERFQSILVSKV